METKRPYPRRLAIAAALLLAQAGQAAPAGPSVKVSGGLVSGSQEDGIDVWRGIPYAAAPVGPLRWRAPQPVVPWPGVKRVDAFAPACAQAAAWVPGPKREDCLYLNVWAPHDARKLPVMVWIHGGGFYGGTASQPLYDGARLARHGVVVVTLNYRLGMFGFFAHPELTDESPDKASGNQGILDQIAALHWVRANISALGGDPDRVTIFGESAGAESVALLVASPLAKGLFQRAIAQSGNDAMPLDAGENPQYERRQAEASGSAYAESLGTPRLADLRALDTETLLAKPWSPRTLVDGHLLREDLSTIYRGRRHNDVPLLVGWNAEEGKDLAPELLGTSGFTAASRVALLGRLLGHVPSSALLAAYPGATDAQAQTSIERLTTDWWGWRMWYWAGLQARYGTAPAYVYYYAHRPAPPAAPCGYGCGIGHGVEIQYVFDNLDKDPRAWTGADRELATRMAATWAAFARDGKPGGPGLPRWPAFDGSNASVLAIGSDGRALPDFTLFAPAGNR